MSDVFQIYLAGGMQDLSFEEQNEWRKKKFVGVSIVAVRNH